MKLEVWDRLTIHVPGEPVPHHAAWGLEPDTPASRKTNFALRLKPLCR